MILIRRTRNLRTWQRNRLAGQQDRYRVRAAKLGEACLYGVHCRCSCSFIVKEELTIFSLGLLPNLEAEKKMWGARFSSAMRSRDDLRRQARILFPWPTTPIAASQPNKSIRRGGARGAEEVGESRVLSLWSGSQRRRCVRCSIWTDIQVISESGEDFRSISSTR
jgi:hypothetical protein